MTLLTATILAIISGCVTTKKLFTSPDSSFLESEKRFSKEFPKKYPPKKIKFPLKRSQKLAIEIMTKEVNKYFLKLNIKSKISENLFEVKILPKGSNALNRYADFISQYGVDLKYDGLYFAKNPFSLGAFDEKNKTLLVSHIAIKERDRLNDVIRHELVHIETYKRKQDRFPSLFYCKFKGKQFSPHYLSCDEMNAYHQDLKRLLNKEESAPLMKSKLKAAKMHTAPIPKLIDNLILGTVTKKDDFFIIQGENNSGKYTVEFPVFAEHGSFSKDSALSEAYLGKVKLKAREYLDFISFIEGKIY